MTFIAWFAMSNVWSPLAHPSTRRIQDVGFRSQLLLLGYPEAARVGEAETLVGGAVVAQDERRRRGRSRLLIGKAAMRKGRGSRGTDDGGVPHAPQPQRADHERSVSGRNSLFLGYPESARVGVGDGNAAGCGVVGC